MPTILNRLDQRLAILEDVGGPVSWKDPVTADRQWAEDALWHTIGPLTDNPRWLDNWSSPSEPVPGFVPGGPAPQWTPEEVIYAMAGDPNLLFKAGAHENPRAPAYGNKGGSPLWRTAMRVSRVYKRERDPSFISDMYSNGFIPLMRMMQPGFDEGRSPFVSYVIKNIESAMQHGVGGTNEAIRAKGGDSTVTGTSGLDTLLKTTDPEEAMRIADQVKGKYQTTKSHDRHQDNPFGAYSSRVYHAASQYAEALRSGNEDQLDKIRNYISQLIEDIESEQVMIPGASTGMGQAISTPDRKSSIGISSMDLAADEERGPMAGNIPAASADEAPIDTEAVYFMLDIALGHDLTKWLEEDPALMEFAVSMGLKPSKTGNYSLGQLTAQELRCLIRNLGVMGSNYPGKGTPRKALNVPRDAKGWLQPLEDPEIEPIKSGGMWHSIWSRTGYQDMGPTQIAEEFTQETYEFQKLGIPTARKATAKQGREEVITKVSVSKTTSSALLKMKIIGHVHKSTMGLDESKKSILRGMNFPIMEDYDPVDRRIICETIDWIITKVSHNLMREHYEQPKIQLGVRPIPIRWTRK